MLFCVQIGDLHLDSYYLKYIDQYSNDSSPSADQSSHDNSASASELYPKRFILKKKWKGAGRAKNRRIDEAEEKSKRLSKLHSQLSQSRQKSPACHPHFRAVASSSSWTWSNDIKFQRLYFYHARKVEYIHDMLVSMLYPVQCKAQYSCNYWVFLIEICNTFYVACRRVVHHWQTTLSEWHITMAFSGIRMSGLKQKSQGRMNCPHFM